MTIQPYLFKNIHTNPSLCQENAVRVDSLRPVVTQLPQAVNIALPEESSPWDGNEAYYYSKICEIRQKSKQVYRESERSSLLVNRLISHCKGENKERNIDYNNPKTCTVVGLALYPESVKVLRDKTTLWTHEKKHSYGQRGEIQSFTPSSRRRLKHVASNSSEPLISQFCLTYHNLLDKGPIVKRKLNLFLNCMRRKYPTFKYLWILEFQSRGFPHFHLYYNLHYKTPGLSEFMAKTWSRISDEKNESHFLFHLHEKNNIAWDMGSAQYLTKYLDKTAQKSIPEDYGWSGRFWGCSRGLVKPPQHVTDEHFKDLVYQFVDSATGEVVTQEVKKIIVRQLGRLHEKRLRKFGRKSRARKTPTDYTISCASKAFWQLWEYYYVHSLEEVPF